MSVRMEELGSHWSDFDKILYFGFFRKSVDEIKLSLKSNITLHHLKISAKVSELFHMSLTIGQ
jgi:hypothetical protein